LEADRGSSLSREAFREDDIPEGEEDVGELGPVGGVEDAREASSKESRGACDNGGSRFEKPMRDMATSSLETEVFLIE